MSTVSRLDHNKARNNPEAVFDQPETLVAEVALTRGEKIASLKRWETSVRRRLDSANEGMAPPRAVRGDEDFIDPIARDAELLRQIEISLDRLQTRAN